MVQRNKQTLLLLLAGFSLFYEVQSGLYVVYPSAGEVQNVNPKFLSRKLDSGNSNDGNTLNNTETGSTFDKTHLHLIYPVNEELIIMTPMPMEEIKERILEVTTQSPILIGDEDHELIAESLPTTDVSETETELPELDGLRIDLELVTTIPDDLDLSTDTAFADDITTTDTITTDVPTTKIEPTDSDSQLLSIYNTTGPMKLLRKRMFEFNRYVPSKQIKLLSKNTNSEVTSTSSSLKYRKRYYTTSVPTTKKKPFSYSKKISNGAATEKASDTTKEHKRYTYKRWFKAPKKNNEEGSVTSGTSKETNEKEQRKIYEQEDSAENRQ